MGDIAEQLKAVGRIERFYVECEDCGLKVIDSARTLMRVGAWTHIENRVKSSTHHHWRNTNHSDFNAVIEGQQSSDPAETPEIDITVSQKS